MVDVQGKLLTVSGKTTVELKFDDFDKVPTTNMYVVEELITDLVIGRNFMPQNNCLVILDASGCRVQFCAKAYESLAKGNACKSTPVEDDNVMNGLIKEEAETAPKEVAETVVHSGTIFNSKPTKKSLVPTTLGPKIPCNTRSRRVYGQSTTFATDCQEYARSRRALVWDPGGS